MRVYLVRHARAVPREAEIREEDRYLTPEGRDLFRRTARRAAKRGLSPDLIFTSPLVRAVQTAEILAAMLKFDGPLPVVPELGGAFGRKELQVLLSSWPEAKEAALVGHEPDLSALAAGLLGVPAEEFPLKKGDIVALEVDRENLTARLLWRTLKGRLT